MARITAWPVMTRAAFVRNAVHLREFEFQFSHLKDGI
jgi:hypothetical protein